MVKMTFTFDEDTVGRLRQAAARLAKPQSYVVREAVREYAARVGALSEIERRQMLHLDTSVLIDALTGPKRSAPALRSWIDRRERVLLSSIVLYEWLRAPRLPEEIEAQEALFPGAPAVPFGPPEAAVAAELYRALRRPNGRELDLAVAACALVHGAILWTLDREDFRDIPTLALA
jgi:predicted nucleic acid-binding protein